MITTGTKLLLGATVLTIVAAVLYGVTSGGSLGTTGLITASVALAFLTGINIVTRDANVAAWDPAGRSSSPAARRAPQSSPWPVVGAVGAALVVVGLVTHPVVFIFGIVALLAAAVEWMLEAWSERASLDEEYNGNVRQRIANPLEFPMLAALGAAVIVYSFSRIMLFLSKSGGPVVFAVVAALVLGAGFLFAYRPRMSSSTMASIGGVAFLALVAGGVATSLAGERDIHHEETTSALATDGRCDTAAETDADHNASQTVGAKANITAEITLRSDGTLTAHPHGITDPADILTITRSNETNIIFNNESDEARRLVLDMGTRPAAAGAAGETTDTGSAAETVPDQLCTALAEGDGGNQFMSFKIGVATSPDTAYSFFVPGVDGQQIEVIVP